jgi:hypothetical protein
MKSISRQKALRIILSSLLSSELSLDDLTDIGHSISRHDDFALTLGSLLQDLTHKIDTRLQIKTDIVFSDKEDKLGYLIEKATMIINRKRLSKKFVNDLVVSLYPNYKPILKSQTTLKDSLTSLLKEVGRESFIEFLELLDNREINNDEYFSGIMRKR